MPLTSGTRSGAAVGPAAAVGPGAVLSSVQFRSLA